MSARGDKFMMAGKIGGFLSRHNKFASGTALVLAVAAMLFAKLFCGYLCPLGTVEDFLSGMRKGLGWKKGIAIRN